MDEIVSPDRNRLSVHNIASLMAIKLMGKPIDQWNATPYVESWLLRHRAASDNRVKTSKKCEVSPHNRLLWSLVD